MVTFPPLMPSTLWIKEFLGGLIKGLSFQEAIVLANKFVVSPREFGRYIIQDTTGETLVLSMAVEGGSRQLRNDKRLSELRLSEHGDWRRIHLRALESCLGKLPFFTYLFPGIEKIYLDRNLVMLKDFNIAILTELNSFIKTNLSSGMPELQNFNILKSRGKEIKEEINPEVSSIETISKWGKEIWLTGI